MALAGQALRAKVRWRRLDACALSDPFPSVVDRHLACVRMLPRRPGRSPVGSPEGPSAGGRLPVAKPGVTVFARQPIRPAPWSDLPTCMRPSDGPPSPLAPEPLPSRSARTGARWPRSCWPSNAKATSSGKATAGFRPGPFRIFPPLTRRRALPCRVLAPRTPLSSDPSQRLQERARWDSTAPTPVGANRLKADFGRVDLPS